MRPELLPLIVILVVLVMVLIGTWREPRVW
jgi:hypothetical protein